MSNLWILTIFYLSLYKIIVHGKSTFTIDTILQEIYNNWKPNHLTVFMNSFNSGTTHQNSFLQKCADKIPIIMIDLIQMGQYGDNRSLEMPSFKAPRSSTMYIILVNENNVELEEQKINSLFDDLISLSPISPRPRSLLFYFSDSSLFEHKFDKILYYAWTLKFLDFSIMVFNCNDVITLNYNPFTNVYSMKYFETVSDVFPDKLSDANNFPLKLPVHDLPPFIMMTENGYDGLGYKLFQVLSEKINFKLEHVIYDYDVSSNISKLTQVAETQLERNIINTVPSFLFLENFIYQRPIVFGIPFEISKYVVIVPIVAISKFTLSINVLISSLLLPTVLLCFTIAVCLMRFSPRYWNILNILQILLGYPIMYPRKLTERIVYLTIVFVALTYSTHIFSKVFDLQLHEEERQFDSTEDILNSHMNIYIIDDLKDAVNPDLIKLLEISKKGKSAVDCIEEKILKTGTAICILPYFTATYLLKLKKYTRPDGSPLMKKAGVTFYPDFLACAYEKASPFATKFDKTHRQIMESGIFYYWKDNFQYGKVRGLKKNKETNYISLQYIIVFLAIGYSLATTYFVCELIFKCYTTHFRILRYN